MAIEERNSTWGENAMARKGKEKQMAPPYCSHENVTFPQEFL